MDISSSLDIPLGRSTHVERAHQEHQMDEVEADVNMTPSSPSPAKKPARSEHSNRDSLIPRFELQLPRDESSPKISHGTFSTADPFSISNVKEEVGELSFTSFDDPLDPTNLSIGQSEVSLSNLDLEAELQMVLNPPPSDNTDAVPRLLDLIPHNASFTTSTPPLPNPHSFSTSGSFHSPSPSEAMPRLSDSLLNISSRPTGSPALRSVSPSMRTGSPLREVASAQELYSECMPRTRISREDAHMRLMRKRSMESPLGSPAPGSPVPHAEPLAAEKMDGRINDGQSNVAPDVGGSDREDERCLDTTPGTVDVSAELAIIQTVEKRTINSATANVDGQEDVEHNEEDTTDAEPLRSQSTPPRLPRSSFGMLETSFDLSGSRGMGLRDSVGSIQLGEMRSALDRLMDDVKGSSGPSTKKPNARSQVRTELVTEGIKTGQSSANPSSDTGDDSMQTEIDMDLSMDDFRSAPISQPSRPLPLPIQHAATDSVVYTGPSFRSPVEEQAAPALPTKDAIRAREQLILEKRRQARRRDQEESVVYYTPPRPTSMPPSADRPSRRRTRSTGDAAYQRNYADSILSIVRVITGFASMRLFLPRADAEQVSHTSFAGDVNSGKAWKAVRCPSDMNEYAKQIREYRSQEKPIQEEPEPELDDSGNATAMACPFPAHLQPPTTKVNYPVPESARFTGLVWYI
ncbi:hypothetical protein EV363DRAFT_1503831 [Boletus edulis]|nr:hypothetical protein EV363DRAFT_1503831 [Boletus edulis]